MLFFRGLRGHFDDEEEAERGVENADDEEEAEKPLSCRLRSILRSTFGVYGAGAGAAAGTWWWLAGKDRIG